MRIAVDAMGGDHGPGVIIEGALRASRELAVEILLVGVEDLIRKEFDRLGSPKTRVSIVNAPEFIHMGEGPLAFRRKKRSSIQVGTLLVRNRDAEAFVSAGNTAAVVFITKRLLGALEGVERPGLSLLVPAPGGLSLFIDVGANANCLPRNLVQFALMGKTFMKNILGIPEPRIGLMSIGEEKSKGNDLTKEAYKLLAASPLHFIGNIEGKDLYSGKADVIVSDGFTGNVALKVTEGVVETFFGMARHEMMKNFLSKIGFFLMRKNLKRFQRRVDYSQYGGAHLLGVNGVCIIGHGRSNSGAVSSAVKLARDFVVNKVQERIQTEIAGQPGCLDGVKA